MQNVTENRNDYIGGSDIPIIMGLSKFKSRWQLLKEKAGIETDEFLGNKYTDYGNVMEDKIRDYINKECGFNFKEDKLIDGMMRYHVDGFHDGGGECENGILEIKTTSRKGDLESYKDYLVQLLAYAQGFGVKMMMLSIYNRPDDFNREFDPERLVWYVLKVDDYSDLLQEIHSAVFDFKQDLEKLKANPFLTENDLQPNEIQSIAQKVMQLEQQLSGFEELAKQHKAMKAELYQAMTKHDIKSWELPNGAKITRVAQGEDKEATAFQEATFKKQHPELHKEFCKKQTKKGRAGYVKITLPKVSS